MTEDRKAHENYPFHGPTDNPYDMPQLIQEQADASRSHDFDAGDFLIAALYPSYPGRNLANEFNYRKMVDLMQAEAWKHPKHPARTKGDPNPYYYLYRIDNCRALHCDALILRNGAPDALQKLASELMNAIDEYVVLEDGEFFTHKEEAVAEEWNRDQWMRRKLMAHAGFEHSDEELDEAPLDDWSNLPAEYREALFESAVEWIEE